IALKHFDQNDVAIERAAKACLKKMHERHADMPQNDAIYCNSHVPKRYVPVVSVFSKPTTASPARKNVSNCWPTPPLISRPRAGSFLTRSLIFDGITIRSSAAGRLKGLPATMASTRGELIHHSGTNRSVGKPP